MPRAFKSMTPMMIPLALAAGLLAACETAPPTQRLPEMTFAHLSAFQVDAARVQVENRFKDPLKAPHVEHLLPTAPAVALEQWAKDRVKAVGLNGTARLIIEDARVTETALARDTSLKGKFTKQQSHRYDMAVRATLELRDAGGTLLAAAGANASRSITAREDISLNDREKLWFDTVGLLMKDFDREMDANIRKYLARWLR